MFCPACEKAEEEIFENVRKYLTDNPDSTLDEVSEATEVPPKKILKYIKDGRITITHGLVGELKCAKCGKPIKEGRFCAKCALNIQQEVVELFDKRSDVGMHTFKKEEKKDGQKPGAGKR